MPGPLRNAVLGAVAATAIAGCGSDDGTIPPQHAEDLLNRVEAVEENVREGQCDSAVSQAEELVSEVNQLPAGVDDEVQQGLADAASNLVRLASSECEEAETGATDAGEALPLDTTETTPPPEAAQPEETTEEPEDDPEEPQTDEESPSRGNQGQGQGGGGNVGADGGVSPSSGGVSNGGGGE